MLTEIVSRMGADRDRRAVKPILHSAANNEHPYGAFNVHGHDSMGCAYCGGVGATSALLLDTDSTLISSIAKTDQVAIFGNDRYTNELFEAHSIFLELATEGHGGGFAVNRQDYVNQIKRGMPVMILAGSHAAARDTGLIHNFDTETVGSASKAAADGKAFYRQDITRVTEAILRNFPELDLDPEVLMRAFLLDSTPVRAVLASHDNDPTINGKLDPRNLAIGIRGNVRAAIERLRLAA